MTKASSFILALLIAVVCAGCGAPFMVGTHIGGELSPSDLSYPAHNPRASHILEIQGTTSATLRLNLTAHYLTNGAAGCNSASSFIAGAVEGVKSPSSLAVPLKITRNAETYSATLAIDEFVPGRCDWQFGYVTADLSKGSLVSLPNIIVRARDGWNTPFVETYASNSSNAPVELHCDFRRLLNDGPNTKTNACVTPDSRTHRYKQEHFYSATTKQLIANFVDDDR